MKNRIKKIVSGMIAASIMTAAIFSVSANLTAEGTYQNIRYSGELQIHISSSDSGSYVKGITNRLEGGYGFCGVKVVASGKLQEGSSQSYYTNVPKSYSCPGNQAVVILRSDDVGGGIKTVDSAQGQHYVTSPANASITTSY